MFHEHFPTFPHPTPSTQGLCLLLLTLTSIDLVVSEAITDSDCINGLRMFTKGAYLEIIRVLSWLSFFFKQGADGRRGPSGQAVSHNFPLLKIIVQYVLLFEYTLCMHNDHIELFCSCTWHSRGLLEGLVKMVFQESLELEDLGWE